MYHLKYITHFIINMPFDWNDLVKEGDILFNYLIHHFDKMLDNTSIKHCNIHYSSFITYYYCDEVWNKYKIEIQPLLHIWIMKEHQSRQLMNKENWKTVRDGYVLTTMFLGYNKLFTYQKYYFQLIIDSGCSIIHCTDCDKENDKILDYIIHFNIALYGWKEDGSNILHPYGEINTIVNDMIPIMDWNNKDN